MIRGLVDGFIDAVGNVVFLVGGLWITNRFIRWISSKEFDDEGRLR